MQSQTCCLWKWTDRDPAGCIFLGVFTGPRSNSTGVFQNDLVSLSFLKFVNHKTNNVTVYSTIGLSNLLRVMLSNKFDEGTITFIILRTVKQE